MDGNKMELWGAHWAQQPKQDVWNGTDSKGMVLYFGMGLHHECTLNGEQINLEC